METRRDWNAQDFETARNVWRRGQSMSDDDRRVMERAAVRFFWKSVGIDRRGMVGETAGKNVASPCACDGRTQPSGDGARGPG